MNRRAMLLACLLSLVGGATASFAQIPGIPAPGGAAPGVPPGAAGAAAAAAPVAGAAKNIWAMICLTPEQKAACRKKLCASPFGQLLNSMLAPASTFSGGLIGPLCPPNLPNPDDLNKPADSAQGAASKIKADEAQAKARREAVKYLGTVDCRYYPEAEAALVNALRGDKNECVRMEAAKVLGNGCCCTAKIIAALNQVLSAEPKDTFPPERSECVKALAYVALERCLRQCPERKGEQPPEKPSPEAVFLDSGVIPANYYSRFDGRSSTAVFAEARETLARGLRVSNSTMNRLSGSRSLVGILSPPRYRAPRPEETLPPPLQTEPQALVVSDTRVTLFAEAHSAERPDEPEHPADKSAIGTTGRRNLLNLFQDSRSAPR